MLSAYGRTSFFSIQTYLAMSFIISYTLSIKRHTGIGLFLGLIPLCLQTLHADPLAFEKACLQAFKGEQLPELSQNLTQLRKARLAQASRLPNPSVFYEQESARSTDAFNESSVGLSVNLDFIWKRGSRIKAAEQKNSASEFELSSKQLKVSYEIANMFIDYANWNKKLKELGTSIKQHEEALTISRKLLVKGMISAFNLKRIELRMDELRFSHKELESNLAGLLAEFQLWVSEEEAIPAKTNLLYNISFETAEKAVEHALRNRPDLLAFEANSKWKAEEVKKYKNEKLPEVSLDISAKKYPGDDDGFFIGMSMEIPLGEKQGDVQFAESEKVSGTLEYKRAKRKVEREVKAAWQIWHHLQTDKNSSLGRSQMSEGKNYLQGLQSSFANGEASVIEYLDGLGSLLTGKQNTLKRHHLKQSAYLRLTYLSASTPSFSTPKI